MNILLLFCEIDDFCKVIEQQYQAIALANGKSQKRPTKFAQSEVITVRLMYHACSYKQLKAFYLQEIVTTVQIFPLCAVIKDSSNCNQDE